MVPSRRLPLTLPWASTRLLLLLLFCNQNQTNTEHQLKHALTEMVWQAEGPVEAPGTTFELHAGAFLPQTRRLPKEPPGRSKPHCGEAVLPVTAQKPHVLGTHAWPPHPTFHIHTA